MNYPEQFTFTCVIKQRSFVISICPNELCNSLDKTACTVTY